MNLIASMRSIGSVAKKEFLHILRDWRVLVLILTLPPAFTLLFGHAFEVTEITDAPAMLRDSDRSPESERLVERLRTNKTFAWKDWNAHSKKPVNLLHERVLAIVEIP